MNRSAFFDRLYFGFQAEHLVAGQLFGAGFEAFKLPADFGFDLMVTSQRQKSLGSASELKINQDNPYVVQVKSRRVSPDSVSVGPNRRPQFAISFQIKSSEYDLLVEEPNSFLVLVSYLPSMSLVALPPTLCVWLCGPQLALLKEKSYLSEEKSRSTTLFRLDIVARLKPRQAREELLTQLRDKGQITVEGFAALEKALPEMLDLNWDASEYVSLLRHPWIPSEGKFEGVKNVAKTLHSKHLDLSRIHPDTIPPTFDPYV
jgi:hypothetical protein